MSSISTRKSQLEPTASPQIDTTHEPSRLRSGVKRLQRKFTTREGWLGDYDYGWLCMPSLPFGKTSRSMPPFYALDAELPLVLAISSGLQHALAMLAGLITPPIIFASALSLDSETSAYMISASLIGCGKLSSITSSSVLALIRYLGILSLVQMSRIKLFKGYYLGTGLISVVGTSFATLSTANAVRALCERFYTQALT